MDFLISCHVLKSTHSYNKAMHGTVEKGRDFKSKADADFIHSFIHFFLNKYFSNSYYVLLECVNTMLGVRI